ncbi:hypothetical protein, partial [Pseudomonas bohemica]|uniref:hypothetical protein n=1 Tax=Pseudomonas bohemica TaxID=2044872 RepID=UPI001F385E9E
PRATQPWSRWPAAYVVCGNTFRTKPRDILGIVIFVVGWAFLHWAFVLNNPTKTFWQCLRRAKARGFEKGFMDRVTTSAVIGESLSRIIERWSAKCWR